MSRKFLALAVALPLVVLALGMMRAERHLRDNRRWVFDVTGYDPRDLLRGRYIQYRLALDERDPGEQGLKACDENSDEGCCLCLAADFPGGPTTVARTTCEAAYSRCDGALQTRYLDELQRYYIPEDRAEELDALFRDASQERRTQVVIAIDKAGKPQVDTLLVDDVPIDRPRAAPALIPRTDPAR
jgi:uncharacterized membrane-anchored protein